MYNKKNISKILIFFSCLILIVVLGWYFTDGKNKKKAEGQESENVYIDIQDAEEVEIINSKSDAYQTYRESGETIEDYWNTCEDDLERSNPDETQNTGGGTSEPTAADIFGKADTPSPTGQSHGGGGSSANPYRETAKEREARHQKRREEALDLADRMQKGPEDKNTPKEEPVETIILPSDVVRRSDVISSLDDGWTESGVSSLDEPKRSMAADETHPFKCMFVREEKIKNGQRVSVRLLEDIVVGGILIPKNSHLMASCNIGRRLDLEITNIEMQGRILSLGYEAYDTDGTKGIYCPDVGSAGTTVKNRGTNLVGTTLSSRVGRLASDVVSTGVSLIQSASGERTVSVPAGYTFYIVKKKQQ